MGTREGTGQRWFIDCDVHEERVYVSVCHDFQVKPRNKLTGETEETLLRMATEQGWTIVTSLGQTLTFCPGCVPVAVKRMPENEKRRYLVGKTKDLTARERIRRFSR